MKKQKTGTGKTLPRIAALGLAGTVLWGGSMPQVNAATLKDLFDEHYYADTFKDLKDIYGYDREALWNHYLQHGLAEGRPMNELFDVVKYKKLYTDLSAAFEDNWDAYANHYLTVGAKEGRESGTDTEFNAFDYVSRYADLQTAFGDNVLALWKHYKTTGAEEDREARSEEVVEAEAEAEREAAEKEEEAQKPDTSEGRTERFDFSDGSYMITEYDENHMIIKITDYFANGDVNYYTLYQYQNGRQVKTTSYYQNGKLKQIQDYTTNPMTAYSYNYDNDWVLTHIDVTRGIGRDPKLEQRTYYDKDGRITRTNYYDDNGKISTYIIPVYKDGKRVEAKTYHADGSYGINEYDDNEKLVKYTGYLKDGKISYIRDYTTNPLTQTRYAYDDNGVLTSIKEYKGSGSDAQLQKDTCYDADGNVTTYYIYVYKDGKKVEVKTYHADGSYGINEYDDNEKLVKYTGYLKDGKISYIRDYTTDPLTQTHYAYDDNDVLTSIKEYKGSGSDAQLQKETFYDADGKVTRTDYYDNNGNISTYIIPVYKDGKKIEANTYHADGSYGINEFDDNEKLVKYTGYLKDGKISYIRDYTTNPLAVTRYTYDENGVLTRIREYLGDGSAAQLQKDTRYDADGNVTTYYIYVYKDGKKVEVKTYHADGSYGINEYDDNEKLVKATSYDKDGNITSITDNYKYTDGKMTESTTYWLSSGHKSINEYDTNGKQIKATWYNKDGRLSAINDYTTSPMTAHHYYYDDNGVLTRVDVTRGTGPNPTLEKRIFYDADGNVTYYTVYTYDEDGTLKTTESFNADGSTRE